MYLEGDFIVDIYSININKEKEFNHNHNHNHNHNMKQSGVGSSNTQSIENELLKLLEMELLFLDKNTSNYNHTTNAKQIITELDSILLEFDIVRINGLLDQLKLCYIDNNSADEKHNEYINKIVEYLNNNTMDHYYNIYKYKCENKILSKMLASLTFSHDTDSDLLQHEKNKDDIFKLIGDIDDLLHKAILDKGIITTKLIDLKGLHLDAEVLEYIKKVEAYILNYDNLTPINRIKAYSSIYRRQMLGVLF